MADVTVKLRDFETTEEAEAVADGIRSAGGITYVNAESGNVNVNVSEVTVQA